MAVARAQLNLEFLMVILFALILLTSLFSLYNSQARELRIASSQNEAAFAAQSLGSAINALSSAASVERTGVSLPSGSYVLSLKGRRVQALAGNWEYSYPLISDSVSMPEPAAGGDALSLTKKNGAIYVSKANK